MPPLSIEGRSPAGCHSGITFREPPRAPSCTWEPGQGDSCRRPRAVGRLPNRTKAAFFQPSAWPLSMCVQFVRGLVHFVLWTIFKLGGIFYLFIYFSSNFLSVPRAGSDINLCNLRIPLLSSGFPFAPSGLFISKENSSNINSEFPMETSTLLPWQGKHLATKFTLCTLSSTLVCCKTDGSKKELDLSLINLIILPSGLGAENHLKDVLVFFSRG